MNKIVAKASPRACFSPLRHCLASLAVICLFLGASSASLAADPPGVLVIPFTVNTSGDAAQVGNDFSTLLNQSLATQGFRVVRGDAGTQDPSRAKELARQAGADFAVYGTFNQLGQGFNINLRLVEADTPLLRPYNIEKNSLLELPDAVNQLAAQAYTGATNQNAIADITVRGLQVIDPDRILVRIASRQGDPINVDRIDEDVRLIWDMGYFSDVTAEVEETGQGEILVFTVVEKPRIDDVRVEGSRAVKIGDITEAMSSRTGTVLNERLLAEDLQKISELYRQKGYYLAEVNYEILARPDAASAALVLNVTEGSKLYLEEIVLDGLQEVRPKEITSIMALKRRGLLSRFLGTGVLDEEKLERDTQVIRAYLINKGYVDAQVSAPEVSYTQEGIIVTFHIREGVRHKLGEIGFNGDLLASEDELYSIIRLDEERDRNEYFKLETMQDDIKRLTDLYADLGHAFAVIDVETNAHDGILDVYYTLNPREKVFIHRVDVAGNTSTRDNVIVRELLLADGQQFSGADLRRSSERLDRLQYFESVDLQLVPTGTPGEVDLKVNVKEKNTGMINLGFGYSTYDQFGISGGIREQNLWGRGYAVGANGYVSGRELSARSYFMNPRIWNTKLGFILWLYGVDEEWTDFDKRTVGSQLRLTYPIGEYTTVNAGYRLDNYEISNIHPWAARSIRDYEGKNWASVLSAGVDRDTTNSVTNPTHGTRTSFSIEYGGGGIGGDDNFIKPVAEWGVYYGLNERHVLHARVSGGAVFRNSSKTVPSFERFYIGGMNSIRGYSTDDLSPRDPRTDEKIGATRMGYANFEYIWHFKQDLGLAFVPFFDIAVSSNSDKDPFNNLYYSAGLELRWRSPMGDLRFAYGFPLTDNVVGERRTSGRFEFAMGQPF